MKIILSLIAIVTFSASMWAQCSANVTASNNPISAGEYTFNNQSTAGPNAYYILTTGDGGTYTMSGFLQTITHQYTSPGAYEYCISIIDSITPCYDTFCDSVYVNSVPVTCNADYWYMNSGTVYDYDFSPAGGATATVTHFWDFGDGSTSTAIAPSHTYPTVGFYTVCHTVTDVNGQCSDTYCDTVNVTTSTGGNPGCQSSFYWYQDSTTTQTVTMINNSVGSGIAYYWDFGDGNTSTQAYPSHQYNSLGAFEVCLTIMDNSNPLFPCTSTFCDSVFVAFKAVGFTINVYPASVAGISEAEKEEVKVYPNPLLDNLFIDSEEATTVYVMSASGQLVYQEDVFSGTSILDLSQLEKGIYLVKIGERAVKRVVKQ